MSFTYASWFSAVLLFLQNSLIFLSMIIRDDSYFIGHDCGNHFSSQISWIIVSSSLISKKYRHKLLNNIICSSLHFFNENFIFSLCPSNCTSLLQNLILINNLVDIFECLFFYMNLVSNHLEFGNCRFNFTDNIFTTTCLYSHFVTCLH